MVNSGKLKNLSLSYHVQLANPRCFKQAEIKVLEYVFFSVSVDDMYAPFACHSGKKPHVSQFRRGRRFQAPWWLQSASLPVTNLLPTLALCFLDGINKEILSFSCLDPVHTCNQRIVFVAMCTVGSRRTAAPSVQISIYGCQRPMGSIHLSQLMIATSLVTFILNRPSESGGPEHLRNANSLSG
jgi:hypothetical protein